MIGDLGNDDGAGDCFGEDVTVCFVLNDANAPRGDCEGCGAISASSDLLSCVRSGESTCEVEMLMLEVAYPVGVMLGVSTRAVLTEATLITPLSPKEPALAANKPLAFGAEATLRMSRFAKVVFSSIGEALRGS